MRVLAGPFLKSKLFGMCKISNGLKTPLKLGFLNIALAGLTTFSQFIDEVEN